ncbi:MAG: hypothetical protein JO288_11140 [Hyphomicrobiales bacterium]|nr:hypothetical protein [Hyphomicrobiales bacterium]
MAEQVLQREGDEAQIVERARQRDPLAVRLLIQRQAFPFAGRRCERLTDIVLAHLDLV